MQTSLPKDQYAYSRLYWQEIDKIVCQVVEVQEERIHTYKQLEIDNTRIFGEEGIQYWNSIIEKYKNLSKEDAVTKLIKAEKLEEKIKTIEKAISETLNRIMNKDYLDKIILGDCINHLKHLEENSIDLFLSDIPYGINQNEWDVFHENTNSAFLGQSPAQVGKSAFKRRGKPINGWNEADKQMNKDYQKWVYSWSTQLYSIMKEGASVFVFGARRTLPRAIVAFEDSGFLLRDVLSWKKRNAHHRAQRVSEIFRKRGLAKESAKWHGWRLGNLAPIYEPIAWFFKPYKSITITDNLLKYAVGAMNLEACKINGSSPTNLLDFWFDKDEKRIHEAQKPVKIMEFLIKLTTRENQIVLDPFMGSGTTAVASLNLNRHFIGFEIVPEYHKDSLERIGKLKITNNKISQRIENLELALY